MTEQNAAATIPEPPAAPVSDQADYVSTESFDSLPISAPVREAIAKKGYTKPTPVQAAALGPILAGRDVIVRSKTGTGKTAAFGIPVVDLIDPSIRAVQALVLCNTRELALQVANELSELGGPKNVKVAAIYGGASMDRQLRELDDGATVVVGTPGRLIDLTKRGTLKLNQARIAVLDEADEMLGEGFLQDVMWLLGKCAPVHQTLLFSASLTPDIEKLVRTQLNDPKMIMLSGDVFTVAGIRNIAYFASDSIPKPRNLLYLLQVENPESAIVFCNTRDDVNLVATVLARNGFDAERLSGELPQGERERVMARIKRGELRFMVATDIAARGIDISDLTHVINYSLPDDAAVYLHRVGRTGRIGKTGTAISLVRGTELHTLTTLQKQYGITFEEKQMPSPEEVRRTWTDKHLAEIRHALGSTVFDAYIPLAQDMKARDGNDMLVAFLLKYFFTHHRLDQAAPARVQDEVRVFESKEKEHKEKLNERREERAKPVREVRRDPAPEARAPAAAGASEGDAPEAPARRNRLFVSLGSEQGLDSEGVKAALAALAGQPVETIESVETKGGYSYVNVAESAVDAYVAATGKSHGERVVSIEIAKPPRPRRTRR